MAPLPSGLFLAHILPSWASTIFLHMNRPRPVPLLDFVANFVNNRGNIPASIPVPQSFILTVTYLSLPSLFFDVVAVMLIVPSLVNLIVDLTGPDKFYFDLQLSLGY